MTINEYCENCRHRKTEQVTEGLYMDSCELDLEPEWTDEEESYECSDYTRYKGGGENEIN